MGLRERYDTSSTRPASLRMTTDAALTQLGDGSVSERWIYDCRCWDPARSC